MHAIKQACKHKQARTPACAHSIALLHMLSVAIAADQDDWPTVATITQCILKTQYHIWVAFLGGEDYEYACCNY